MVIAGGRESDKVRKFGESESVCVCLRQGWHEFGRDGDCDCGAAIV